MEVVPGVANVEFLRLLTEIDVDRFPEEHFLVPEEDAPQEYALDDEVDDGAVADVADADGVREVAFNSKMVDTKELHHNSEALWCIQIKPVHSSEFISNKMSYKCLEVVIAEADSLTSSSPASPLGSPSAWSVNTYP